MLSVSLNQISLVNAPLTVKVFPLTVAEAEKINQEYDAQREEWEQKVKLLSSTSLDLDLLDERARTVLNMIGDDEFIILDDDSDTTAK